MSTHSQPTPTTIGSIGHLIAELPGVFGFLPADSVVIIPMVATDNTSKATLGPILRYDITETRDTDNERGILTNIATHLHEHEIKETYILVINDTVPVQHELAYFDMLPKVSIIWHTTELVTNSFFYALDHNPASPVATATTITDHLGGVIAPIHASSSLNSIIASGEHIEISRTDAAQRFKHNPELIDPDIAQEVEVETDALTTMRETQVRSLIDTAVVDLLRRFNDALCRADDYVARGQEPTTDMDAVVLTHLVFSGLPTVQLRDAGIKLMLAHPQSARALLRHVATTATSNYTRATTLVVYAIVGTAMNVNHDTSLALEAAQNTQPTHTLVNLIHTAYTQGQMSQACVSVDVGATQMLGILGLGDLIH